MSFPRKFAVPVERMPTIGFAQPCRLTRPANSSAVIGLDKVAVVGRLQFYTEVGDSRRSCIPDTLPLPCFPIILAISSGVSVSSRLCRNKRQCFPQMIRKVIMHSEPSPLRRPEPVAAKRQSNCQQYDR